jgi:catechol 2,3-dioxygenase-like lactoylglutathione lyase family enzyme
MAFNLHHVHLKTPDPEATAKFYVDNFGATVKDRPPGRGVNLDLHGLQLNITRINTEQKHDQHFGIEHIAVQTDDFDGTMAALRASGVTILEQLSPGPGRQIAFVQCPDGAQMEVIKKV